jgi:F0F1-type ATP synthase membrane subunit c/vacuolar-type H+-ATPase subunit K
MAQQGSQPLGSLRMIVVALASGVLLFTVVAVFLRRGGTMPDDAELGGMLALIAAGIGVLQLPVYLALRARFRASARERKAESLALVKEGRVPPPLMSLTIIGAALAEGVGLFGVVALLLGAPWYALVLPALSIVLILAQMPSRERLEGALREA